MPAPIPEHTKQAILDDIKAGDGTCRGIARKHGVSDATVRKIAKQAGITNAFAREHTENATRARQADMAAQRAQIAADLLTDVQRLRKRAWDTYQVIANGPDGPETITLDQPPLRDVQAAYTSVGIALDKHLALVKHDSDPGIDAAKSMLGALAAGLGAAYDQLNSSDGD
jgi:hypothetical protein